MPCPHCGKDHPPSCHSRKPDNVPWDGIYVILYGSVPIAVYSTWCGGGFALAMLDEDDKTATVRGLIYTLPLRSEDGTLASAMEIGDTEKTGKRVAKFRAFRNGSEWEVCVA